MIRHVISCFGWIISAFVANAAMAPAFAHAPIQGIGAFYNGMLHPVLVPIHLLLLLGLGLLLGQHASRHGRMGWAAFVAAFWLGLIAGQAAAVPVPAVVLSGFAAITGLAVALEPSLGKRPVLVLLAAAGITVGLDSRADDALQQGAWLAVAGTAIGGVLLLSYAAGLAVVLTHHWQRIGVRVAGSWIVASAAIDLALVFARRGASG